MNENNLQLFAKSQALNVNENFPNNTFVASNCSNFGFVNRILLSFSYKERLFEFLMNAILSGIIILAGILGNIISIMVLKRDWKRSSMSVLLLGLAVFDLMFLFMSIYYMIIFNGFMMLYPQAFVHIYDSIWMRNLLLSVWYLGNVSRTGRNWIIVVVAIDRFVVVHNPLAAAQKSNPYRAKIYFLTTLLLACVYNIPRPLEWTFRVNFDPCTKANVTSMDLSVNLSKAYMIGYMSVGYCLFIAVGPVVLLTIFNLLLTACLIEAHKIHVVLINQSNHALQQASNDCKAGSSATAIDKGRYSETKMLIVVIAVFVITELPSSIFQGMLTHATLYHTTLFNGFWSYFKTSMDVLTMINSSVNFLIYCMCGRRFRKNMRFVLRRTFDNMSVHFGRQESMAENNTTNYRNQAYANASRIKSADVSRLSGKSTQQLVELKSQLTRVSILRRGGEDEEEDDNF